MMRVLAAMIFCLAFVGVTSAQTTTTSLPASGQLDFGVEGLSFPPVVTVNGHTPRTAQLLGEAYRRREPLVWKRVQYVADIGQVALPAGAPYLVDAMKDDAPPVRAQAARSAAMVGEPSLLPQVEKLLADSDASVRREAVLSAAKLAREQKLASSPAIERGLADPQPQVVAASLQAAWTAEHATQIAQKLAGFPKELQAEAAAALGRIKSPGAAAAVLPLLNGDVTQRVAAVRALGEMADVAHAEPVLQKLADPHPTVRRAAVASMAKLADEPTQHARAIKMLADADPTVREAAARVLTPVPSTEALDALLKQLDEPYAPLHEAVRQALSRPRDAALSQATIARAAALLAQANPRRQEDASYILGRLRSDAAIERHLALLQWDPASPAKSDWPLIAQAAESLGLIGDARANEPLMKLIKPAPDALAGMQRPQVDAMTKAMSNALVAAARLHHRAAIDDAVRILQLDPATCPSSLRAAASFAIGLLAEPGKLPSDVNFITIYESPFEAKITKLEALKALGNNRHAPLADRLKVITESDATPDLRWMAQWAYQRCSNTRVAYQPPTERRAPPVLISDLPQPRQ
jgi:HEAT repeat protein